MGQQETRMMVTEEKGGGTLLLTRIILALAVAVLIAVMMTTMAVPAFALPPKSNGDPHPSQGKADPPTVSAGHGCKGFDHTPTNEPPFFQSSNVTC